jgi:hypothetical protein
MATLAAMAVAAVLLVTVVMPAEFGRDPTGIGHRLGLFRPAAEAAIAGGGELAVTAIDEGATPLVGRDAPFRSDEMSVTLKSGEGAEIKAVMSPGDRMVFSWAAGGDGVDVDMHGEATGAAAGQATSYAKGEWQKSGHGAFTAPFAGNHGWFWQNLNDDPVTVTVRVSGYYQKLFRP